MQFESINKTIKLFTPGGGEVLVLPSSPWWERKYVPFLHLQNGFIFDLPVLK